MAHGIVCSILVCGCAVLWLTTEAIHYYDDAQQGAVYNFDVKYIDVRDRPTFIDRTRFTKHFYQKNELMVIHAPPKFGKTSNLRMLQMFFEIPVDSAGTILNNYVLQKRQFFDTLFSCRDMDSFFCADTIATHPVIYLDFNDLNTEDLESFCASFREMLSELFRNHEYLQQSQCLDRNERTMFDEDLHPNGHPLLREETYALSGHNLSMLLHKHFNSSCMVLIDNYDSPITKLIIEGTKDDSTSQIFKILADLMAGLLKDNKFVSHSLLTGASSLGSIHTQTISHLKYYSIFENKTLSDFYGLKFRDIEDLLGRFGREVWLQEAQRTYEGYRVLGTNENMYAVHSFSKFMETKGPGDFKPVPILPKLKKLFEYDKLGKTVEKTLDERISIDWKLSLFSDHDIKNLHSLVTKSKTQLKNPVQTEHLMMQFLQENGCYTIIDKNEQLCKADMVVPNLEIKKVLQRLLYTENFFIEKYQASKDKLKKYVDSLVKLENKEESFQVMMTAIRALFEKVLPETEPEFRAPLYSLPNLMNKDSFLRVDNDVVAPNRSTIDTLVVRKDKTMILFNFRFERESSFVALLEIIREEQYKFKLKLQQTPRNYIMVGLHFSEHRDCSVSYLYNTANATRAVTLTHTS